VGLLALVSMLQLICEFWDIQEGSITVACDNISALDSAFDTDQSITCEMADHDILSAIRHHIQQEVIKIIIAAFGVQDHTTKQNAQAMIIF